jgi:hypothetical protein
VSTLDNALRATAHRLELRASAWQSSVDESLIRQHLERSPGERIKDIELMYSQAQQLARAGARARSAEVERGQAYGGTG